MFVLCLYGKNKICLKYISTLYEYEACQNCRHPKLYIQKKRSETQNVNFFSRGAIICIRKQVMYVVKNAIDFQDYTCGSFEM